jgi:hypothetical protein
MKHKIIMIISGLAAVGFMGRNQLVELKNKYLPGKDTVAVITSEEVPYIDTILENSKKNIASVGEKNLKSDSLIVTKVEKTAKNIEVLHKEVKILKKENNELKARLHDTDGVNQHFGLLPIATEAAGE